MFLESNLACVGGAVEATCTVFFIAFNFTEGDLQAKFGSFCIMFRGSKWGLKPRGFQSHMNKYKQLQHSSVQLSISISETI